MCVDEKCTFLKMPTVTTCGRGLNQSHSERIVLNLTWWQDVKNGRCPHTNKPDVCREIHTTVLYPKLPLQRWLEDPVERALSVAALSEVEDVFDNFLALLEVSRPGVVED